MLRAVWTAKSSRHQCRAAPHRIGIAPPALAWSALRKWESDESNRETDESAARIGSVRACPRMASAGKKGATPVSGGT